MRYCGLKELCFTILLSLLAACACSSEKEVAERRSLMIPRTSELLKNDKYREPPPRKTNKIRLNKAGRKSLY